MDRSNELVACGEKRWIGFLGPTLQTFESYKLASQIKFGFRPGPNHITL